MRKQIAAANWKMNLTYQQAEQLMKEILEKKIAFPLHQQVLFAVPFPYLIMARNDVAEAEGFSIAAQNCSYKKSGAYTGEVSAEMLQSIGINYCIIGHSERREYFGENNKMLADKINLCLAHSITPVFCCGETLPVRESGTQNEFVQTQLAESLFHLDENKIESIIIAYEPIWAIGTGKTATTEQVQEMHTHIRAVIAATYNITIADKISILYGGSVKGSNAVELFNSPDVDGGLVGGASLVAQDFLQIIKALKP